MGFKIVICLSFLFVAVTMAAPMDEITAQTEAPKTIQEVTLKPQSYPEIQEATLGPERYPEIPTLTLNLPQ